MLSIYDIKDYMESVVHVDLAEKTRKHHIAHYRFVYYKLCRTFTQYSLEEIGASVNAGHCSVIHGLRCFDDNTLKKQYYAIFERILKDLTGFVDKSKIKDVFLMPRKKMVEYYEDKINKIHLEYLTKIDELTEQNKSIIENKAILSISNELSKLSDGEIHIFKKTRLEPFILMSEKMKNKSILNEK